jgi:hypothetical protein
MRSALAGLALLIGCEAPPPAPEGLDDSVGFIMNEFYSDDLTFGAGLTGLLNWFDDEGTALLDVDPNIGNVADFALQRRLTFDDVSQMPVTHGRDPEGAPGVVGLAEIDCDWSEGEALHVRGDQDVVFEGEWTTYTRTYESPRPDYDAAREADEYPAVRDRVDPAVADWTSPELAPVFLRTSNALGTSSLGVDFEYTMDLTFRHGEFEVQGEPTSAMVILTWMAESVDSTGADDNQLLQVYSIDMIVGRGDGLGLRIVANYTEVGGAVDSGSELVQSLGVARILDFAEHLDGICTGARELPLE